MQYAVLCFHSGPVRLCQYLYIRCWITVTSHFSVTHTRTGFFVGQIHWSSAIGPTGWIPPYAKAVII